MTNQAGRLPRISVVVPSYNQGCFLPESLESIFRQQYPDLEVVVMDGGSTDDSVEIIRRYAPRLKHWQSEKDGGQSAAINAGMKHCTGQLVAWLNSDDYYWRDALWTAGRAWSEHPDRGLYIGNGFRFDQKAGKHTPFCPRHVALDREALLRGTDYILQPSVFFLREAWEAVGGLEVGLGWCMDWDVLLRISARYPAVLINEFLGVSREYEETKTRSGKLARAFEIVRMVRKHTGVEATPGSLIYLLQSIAEVTEAGGVAEEVPLLLRRALRLVNRQLGLRNGGSHGFPQHNDPQDRVYLPFAQAGTPEAPGESGTLPAVSIVIPCRDEHNPLLQRTLDSITSQGYVRVRSHVVEPTPEAPARALNAGLATAGGEVLAWLSPGDELTLGALRAVGRAFADDPALDVVYGNAVFLDEANQPCLARQSFWASQFWYGAWQPPGKPLAHGADVFAMPPPTVFFRRRLLERLGPLSEAYRHVFAYEWFGRPDSALRVQKLERTQAFCRLLPEHGPERWQEALEELYELTRAQWPRWYQRRFRSVLREFVGSYMRRRFPRHPHNLTFWRRAAWVALAAVTRCGNPERWWREYYPAPRHHVPPLRLPLPLRRTWYEPLFVPERTAGQFHVLLCTPQVPREDGREATLLRHLAGVATVEVLCHDQVPSDTTPLDAAVCHTPATIAQTQPDLVNAPAARSSLLGRWAAWLRSRLPLPGARYPGHVGKHLGPAHAYGHRPVRAALGRDTADYVIVSPQYNPLALTLTERPARARLILLADAVEEQRLSDMADRRWGLSRFALRWEARRARTFERSNLERFDAVLAACDEDRQRFIDAYGVPAERVHVLGDREQLLKWLQDLAALPPRARIAKPLAA